MIRRAVPYAVAIGGAIAITAAIAVVDAVAKVSGLSAFYLLLVLWLAARWGRGPAIAGSVAAFLLYDFFFVPPVGTFNVRGPAELLELVVLLAVALVTSQLAASLREAQGTAQALAKDSRALYELATAALRMPELSAALSLVCAQAVELKSVSRFALVAVDTGEASVLAGGQLTSEELRQAAWSFESGKPIGIAMRAGVVVPIKGRDAAGSAAYLPLAGGVAVMTVVFDHPEEGELRMLGALIALADLLLDRRRATLEAERARGLEASDRLKAAILSSLSHELKSPIASLRAGLTALTSPQAGLQTEQRELLTDMDRQASRLDHMVGDLLALSRLEAGVELEREPHSFADIVGASLHHLKSQLKEHQVTVRIPDDLPPVEVDELQAGRLIGNLVENALEWSSEKGGIEIGALASDGRVEAWVENEGTPIAPADLDRVFDTFWTRRARGTGLGLAISKRVVEAHGGTIRAENRRRGPRFTFTLPLASVPAPP